MNAASQEDQQELCVGFDGVTPRAPHVAGLYQLCLTKVKSPRALEKEQNLKPILYLRCFGGVTIDLRFCVSVLLLRIAPARQRLLLLLTVSGGY